jgi:hypothetical protein
MCPTFQQDSLFKKDSNVVSSNNIHLLGLMFNMNNDALMWSPVTYLFYLGDKLGYLDNFFKDESDYDLTYFFARVMVMLIFQEKKYW